jgi:predicted NBD/HSP70 family sugar kinase
MTAPGPAGPRTVKRHNLALVLRELGDESRTRAQLAQSTGLTRATASSLVDELLRGGLLVERDASRGGRGRPANPVQLNPNGPAGLGVEVNVDYTSACIVDLTGALRVHRTVAADNRSLTPAAGLERAAHLAAEVLAQARGLGLQPYGAGLALPGIVDAGVLRRAPNLPEWHDLAADEAFGRLMAANGLPSVVVENEANLAALAELWFAPGPRDFVHVSGEIGVGAGVVLDGELFRGVRGYAGELGHVVVDPAGPRCVCGSSGCLEQLAGQEALLRSAGISTGVGNDLLARARDGDPRTLAALEQAGRALGIALSGVINVLDVPVVVLSGLYARLGDWLCEPISAELDARVISRAWAGLSVRVSALTGDAAVRGAAGAVVQQLLVDPSARI